MAMMAKLGNIREAEQKIRREGRKGLAELWLLMEAYDGNWCLYAPSIYQEVLHNAFPLWFVLRATMSQTTP